MWTLRDTRAMMGYHHAHIPLSKVNSFLAAHSFPTPPPRFHPIPHSHSIITSLFIRAPPPRTWMPHPPPIESTPRDPINVAFSHLSE
ncbi:Uncharacterized protein TCM_010979 [Theobroma cacao]|uniref:Uncharacterized protein n=1 Tax=Theobroma cacao TaxID=3641 RepID=A0A061EFH1_THECC|nr:Uncharacterized protein TCM_010979 [Theobroma cacao]